MRKPEQKNRNYTLYLNSNLMNKINTFCKQNNMSKSAFINDILDNAVNSINSLFPVDFSIENNQGAMFLSMMEVVKNQVSELVEMNKELHKQLQDFEKDSKG